MNTQAAAKEDPISLHSFDVARCTAAERLVLVLTVAGMAASLVAFISHQETRSHFTSQLVAPPGIVQSRLYYIAHAVQIVVLIPAGLLALISTDVRTITRGYLLKFALFLGAALLMAARGYSSSELFSTRLADWTGPFPCFVSVLVFVGARRRNWVILGKAMVILAVLFSALVLWRLAGLQTFTRAEGGAGLTGFVNALYWPASWIALKHYEQDSFVRHLRFGPVLIYCLGSLFTQTRLNFVMVCALLVVYTYLERRRKSPQAATWVVALAVAVWASLFAAIFLRDTDAFETTASVATALYSRLGDDSRTGQLVWFAESVHPGELLLGRGSLATWYWNGEYSGGTDVGYLTLLLYGGAPLLLTYIATHLTPCLTVLRKNPAAWQLTAAAVVLLWGIRMLSSSYPGMSVDYYPILFCLGACISTEPVTIEPRAPYRATHCFRKGQ